MEFKNLLAFMVLMSGTEILHKAPSYLIEKFRQYTGVSLAMVDGKGSQAGWLDAGNMAIYNSYLARWGVSND